jgi:hypothetical protein
MNICSFKGIGRGNSVTSADVAGLAALVVSVLDVSLVRLLETGREKKS